MQHQDMVLKRQICFTLWTLPKGMTKKLLHVINVIQQYLIYIVNHFTSFLFTHIVLLKFSVLNKKTFIM